MNLTSAITELQARGGSYLTSAGGRPTIMLNDAKNELEDFYPWPWLETTTTGTAPLTISDLKYVLYVVDTTNKVELRGVDAGWIISQEGTDIAQTGDPSYWYLDGLTSLKVFPANTSVSLSVRYVKYSAELTGSDTPGIPTRYHNLWIDLAMCRVYEDSDDFQAASALRAQTQKRLGQLVEEFEQRNRQNPMVQSIVSGALDA